MKLSACLLRASLVVALSAAPLFAQSMSGMDMPQNSRAGLEVQDDPAAQVLTVRLGPLSLPAHSITTYVSG